MSGKESGKMIREAKMAAKNERTVQKKPPESPYPRGAKDTDSSGSDWTLWRRGCR